MHIYLSGAKFESLFLRCYSGAHLRNNIHMLCSCWMGLIFFLWFLDNFNRTLRGLPSVVLKLEQHMKDLVLSKIENILFRMPVLVPEKTLNLLFWQSLWMPIDLLLSPWGRSDFFFFFMINLSILLCVLWSFSQFAQRSSDFAISLHQRSQCLRVCGCAFFHNFGRWPGILLLIQFSFTTLIILQS